MSAEYLMKTYLQEYNIQSINVSSAGTEANPEDANPTTIDRLHHYNCDPSKHIQRKISKEILEQQDIIICMWNNHKKITENLWFNCKLFNEIAYNKDTDVPDIEEFLAPGFTEQQKSDYIIKVIDYLYEAIPFLAENIIKK